MEDRYLVVVAVIEATASRRYSVSTIFLPYLQRNRWQRASRR
jgi:hypothetical protein